MSAEVVMKIMRGKYPGMPEVYMSLVDVRDVALAHLNAIILNPPSGRYILAEGIFQM